MVIKMKRLLILSLIIIFGCDTIPEITSRAYSLGDPINVVIGTGHNLYNLSEDQQWISFYVQNFSDRRINLLPFDSQGFYLLEYKIDEEWSPHKTFGWLTENNSLIYNYETKYDSVQILLPGVYRLKAIISDEKKLNANSIESHEFTVRMISENQF